MTPTQTRSYGPHRAFPPLRDGDRLAREEFERRYDATPNHKKAELLEGIVYMAPPVSYESHGGPQFDLIAWLGVYRASTPGILGGDNATLRLDLENEPQPDAFLFVHPSKGGQARISADDYMEGAPEFVAEVSASSAIVDLGIKHGVYQRNGVREYVVWRVPQRVIDWFVLRNGEFVPLVPDADGVFRSRVLPGLWLDAAALIAGDVAAVLRVLQRGLATPEHDDFVARLARPLGE